MNWTNVAGLPAPLASAIQYSDYDSVGNISVTGLILPPRIRILQKRHANEITEDVSEGIWRLIGSIGHRILEHADTHNHLAEERLTMECDGWTVSGKADLLGPDMTLDDYKFRSVWAMKEAKPEDEAQLNLYALLYRVHGFEPKRARIIAVLRDWSKPKANREPDYPQVGVVVREVPLWPAEKQQEFLAARVRVHQGAEEFSDDELPLCSDEERWKRPDTWAVKKKGAKRALRVFDIENMAHLYMSDAEKERDKLEIEHRPGSYPRCAMYCNVAEFCSFGRQIGKAESEDQ